MAPDPTDPGGGAARATLRAPSPHGLHARPAARVVATARRFRAEVVLLVGTSRARAKDLLDVLALGAPGGTSILVEASGDDAADAVAAIERLFAAMEGEG